MCPHPLRGPHCKILRPRRPIEIRIIDFGGATFADEEQSLTTGTRQFRPPEVVLRTGWNESADMWSAGCIIGMLYTGQKIFQTDEDLEHLAMMEKICGARIPRRLRRAGYKSSDCGPELFDANREYRLAWPQNASSQESLEAVEDCKSIRKLIGAAPRDAEKHAKLPHLQLFASFLEGLLELDPRDRTSATEALTHPFLATQMKSDDG